MVVQLSIFFSLDFDSEHVEFRAALSMITGKGHAACRANLWANRVQLAH